jgi:hypothetical protein
MPVILQPNVANGDGKISVQLIIDNKIVYRNNLLSELLTQKEARDA